MSLLLTLLLPESLVEDLPRTFDETHFLGPPLIVKGDAVRLGYLKDEEMMGILENNDEE